MEEEIAFLNKCALEKGHVIDFNEHIGLAVDCYDNEDLFVSFVDFPDILNDVILYFNYGKFPEHYNLYENYIVAIRLSHFAKFMFYIISESKEKYSKPQKTYLIVDNRNGLIKIGRSNNPSVREKTLQSEVPNVSIIFVIDKNVEKQLHRAYRQKRVRGEWFRLSEEDIASIKDNYK